MAKTKDTRILPVYDIETFRGTGSKNEFFDIKILEQHLHEHEVTLQPHRHDCYLILLVTQGHGKHIIDFETHEVNPFSAFFLTPGQVHSWNFTEDAKGYVIFFTSSFYMLYKREKHLTDFPFFRTLDNPGTLQLDEHKEGLLITMLQEMVSENTKEEFGRDEMLRNCLDIILTRLSRYYEQSTPLTANSAVTLQMRQLESLIETHFIKLKSPAEYADLMNVTPKHLNDVCKLALNKTVSDLIHERQLLEAKRLLAFTMAGIKQIADHLEFNDKSYFMRFFKKYMGVTPDQFRENYLKVQRHP